MQFIDRFKLGLFFLAVLATSFSTVLSQNTNFEYGSVTVDELKMKYHALDTSASAIIIFDIGKAIVEGTSTIGTTIKRHLRIKFFKKNAFEDWGTMKFMVQKGGMSNLKGSTYNLVDGKIIASELNNASIFKKKYSKYTEEISIAFPNLQEGSMVELSFTEKAEDAFLPSWRFQHSIPTLLSEYSLSSPIKDFTPHLFGSIQPKEHVSKYEGKFQKWIMTNIPAFISEPLMPDKSLFLSTIQFGRYSSWEEIAKHYATSAESGGILEYHGYLKDKVQELTNGVSDPKEKIKIISNFIKREVKWNGVNDIYADEPRKTLERKEGTAADINLMLGSMLKKAGIEIGLILLSTRDNGIIREDFPSFYEFNYVVCEAKIDSTSLYLDATDSYLPYDVLPEKCLNHKGFFASNGKYGWRKIEPTKRKKTGVNAAITISEKGTVKGAATMSLSDYASYNMKRELANGSGSKQLAELVTIGDWKTSELKVIKTDTIEKPLFIKYEIESDAHVTISNDLLYFNPFLFLKEEKNPFTLEERIYPIDFDGISEKTLVCSIDFPESYSVEELPQSKVIALPENAAKCFFNISQTGNRILITSRLQINKTLFQPFEYKSLKEFYARLISKSNESIVLKRKSN